MCGPTHPSPRDAATELAALINTYCERGVTITAGEIRKLVRDKWDSIKVLAHAVHGEETSEFRRQQRRCCAELDDYKKYG
jgi:hypothetical protein